MMQRSWIELCTQPSTRTSSVMRILLLTIGEHFGIASPRQFGLRIDLSDSRTSGDVRSSRSSSDVCSSGLSSNFSSASAYRSDYDDPCSEIVGGSPPVRRRAVAGVACFCLLPSTEVRTRSRSDSLAFFVATFLPATCSCVAVERSPGLLLGFRCRALARSRSRSATLKASPP